MLYSGFMLDEAECLTEEELHIILRSCRLRPLLLLPPLATNGC